MICNFKKFNINLNSINYIKPINSNNPFNPINIKQKKPEFYDWRWAEPLELPKLIVPFKKRLYQEVVEEFKNYL